MYPDVIMMKTTPKSGSGVIRWKEGSKPVSKHTNKQWIHSADTLTRGSLVYTVRFFGRCEVDRPKGPDTVKEAIRKMKMRYAVKSDGGKPDKVELVISVDGVAVHDTKSKMALHHYPLHRISYCADDKTDKKMFTFIAREGSTDQHCCYVFSSDKCAEEIALTVGQAFDLAYQKFLESYGKETELRKHVLSLQHKINDLEEQNKLLKARVKEFEKDQERPDLQQYLRPKTDSRPSRPITIGFGLDGSPSTNGHVIQSPNGESAKRFEDLGPKLRSTSLGSTGSGGTPALISPPPKNPRSGQIRAQPIPSLASSTSQPINNRDLLTSLFPADESDPFGMGSFQQQTPNNEFFEMQNAFSRGLDLGSDDFSLEDLDPLNYK